MDVTDVKHSCEMFFGLRETPFSLTPDTGFYVNMPDHKAAFDAILYGLSAGEGFIKITGEVGTGKTLLCRRLLRYLNTDQWETAYIPNPALSSVSLWRALAVELGVKQSSRMNEMQHAIQQYLLDTAKAGRKLVLVIDEAQSMPVDTLEALRLISNLETERQKLVHIVLFGQPELDHILARQDLRQLNQRITTSAQLNPLSDVQALSHYLNARLTQAGYLGAPLFSRQAVQALWFCSYGIPRLANVIADKSLLIAFGKGERTVKEKYVQMAIADTGSVRRHSGWLQKMLVAGGLGKLV